MKTNQHKTQGLWRYIAVRRFVENGWWRRRRGSNKVHKSIILKILGKRQYQNYPQLYPKPAGQTFLVYPASSAHKMSAALRPILGHTGHRKCSPKAAIGS